MIDGPAYSLRAEIYDCFFGDRTAEIDGWRRLAQRAGSQVVEWMCGTGVLARALAKVGMDVIGVDSVAEMLAVASDSQKNGGLSGQLAWELGDMRDAVLPRRENDFAFVAAGSFGHLNHKQDHLKALTTAHRHLRPGGTLAMHLSLAGKRSLPWTTRGPFEALSRSITGIRVRKVFVRNSYDAHSRLYSIHEKIEIEKDGEQKTLEYKFKMRHFTPEEANELFTASGYVNIRMFGDFRLNPWYQGAPEWIVCADKP